MTLHRYTVGQKVSLRPATAELRHLRGTYTVIRRLPSETRDPQYRIKSDSDNHERVVLETQLSGQPISALANDPWLPKPQAT